MAAIKKYIALHSTDTVCRQATGRRSLKNEAEVQVDFRGVLYRQPDLDCNWPFNRDVAHATGQ